MVATRSVFADELADLVVPELGDEPGSQDQAQGQRRQGGVGGAKGDVAEYVQNRELVVKGVQQMIDQGLVPFSRSAAIRSIPIPRDPLIKRKSPLQTKPDRYSAASSEVPK